MINIYDHCYRLNGMGRSLHCGIYEMVMSHVSLLRNRDVPCLIQEMPMLHVTRPIVVSCHVTELLRAMSYFRNTYM